ncbi:YggS family pyridoxal phosphate-dependent enzyme [Clostridium swellfunianum]|uniref:YggS family pyridoxal phosphate-dependent enzyme n=1 Tax=Clostridium swellfunianum TaxID=1367462 RepID=UPI00202DE367|nr:YggS family pyridoxal phosphate-dependent enzyme [Clostridium swellfunianum]MCM0650408.1 YggS family pyridoxal phosphate-dependent enzyme [Clostridium swellfunianum]
MSIADKIKTIKDGLTDDITLIAVSKYKSVQEINEAYDCGIRNFGENRVQELLDKNDKLPKDIRWHLIGHLQRNKVKYIVGKVELIHSLDSIKLLEEIERQYGTRNMSAKVLIQINIGEEESKTGIKPQELEHLLEVCESCKHVEVEGLMAIIPIGDEESCRNYFKQVKQIFDSIKLKKYNNIHMKYLSMGMTNDYKIAVLEGSNMIRVGTGIFGRR